LTRPAGRSSVGTDPSRSRNRPGRGTVGYQRRPGLLLSTGGPAGLTSHPGRPVTFRDIAATDLSFAVIV
jgi:hypothetical protein